LKTAKLFRNGQSQAVRLPKEFRFEGSEVYIQRSGNAIVLLPVDAPWQTLFDSLETFTDDFTADLNDNPSLDEGIDSRTTSGNG
jgi:antitoxin VapB